MAKTTSTTRPVSAAAAQVPRVNGDGGPPGRLFTRVTRPREQVEAQLRRAILGGQFGDASELPSEAALAAVFSVSRTTVREALRSLATSGLIGKAPGSGREHLPWSPLAK